MKNVSEDNFYTLTKYVKTQKALSTMEEGEIVYGDKVGFNIKGNKTLLELANYVPSDTNFSKAWPKDSKQDELDLGDDEIINILSLRGAKIIDLTKHEVQSTSELVDELKELNKKDLTFTVSALYNDDKDSDGFRDVHVLVITGTDTAPKHVDKDAFSVTVSADDAQVTVSGAPAADVKKGTEVTLTITAKDGFKIDEITVDGKTVTPVDDKVTFTVDDDVKVVVKSSAVAVDPGDSVALSVVDADSKGFTLKTEAGDTVAPEADGSFKLDPSKIYVLDSTDPTYFPDIRKGDVRYANTFKPEDGMTLTIAKIAENTFVSLKFPDGTTEVAGWYNPPAASPAALAAEEEVASDVSFDAPVRLEAGKTYKVTLKDNSTITLKCELKNGIKILSKAGDTTDDQMIAFQTQASKPQGVAYTRVLCPPESAERPKSGTFRFAKRCRKSGFGG